MNGWIRHGRRRIWWAPWRLRCACGVDAYPCPALRQQWRVAAAQDWQAAERQRHQQI